MFKFSEHGIENKQLFCTVYADFIEWCKGKLSSGTFSTYMDGEPVCFNAGVELKYRMFLMDTNSKKKI